MRMGGRLWGMVMSDRAEFDEWFRDNHEMPGETVNLQMKADMWAGWQAARAQGGEAVKWCKDKGHQSWFLRTGEQCTCGEKFEYHTRLYTHPQPAQQGVPEDALWEVLEAAADILFRRAAPHAWEAQVQDACRKVIMKWRDKIATTPQPADGWILVPAEAIDYLKDQWPGAYTKFYDKVNDHKRPNPPEQGAE